MPGAADKSWTQTWDGENRLVKVEKVKGAEKRTVAFTYDPFGRRIGKQLTTVIDGVTKTSSWSYSYDNEDIVLESFIDENGTMAKTFYTHGPGIDEPLALERNGQFVYYHADGLGSIASLTDADGSVVQSYQYEAYGMVKPSTAFRNSYTYTGREWDKETGLYYYRARYYDPMEGRFISKDPISFAGGDVNLYGYVQNNPTNSIDPSGLAGIRIFTKPLINAGIRQAVPSNMNPSGGRIVSSGISGAIAGVVDGGLLGGFSTPEMGGLGAIPGAILGGVAGFTGGLSTQTILESGGYGNLPQELRDRFNDSMRNSSNPNRFNGDARRCH